MKRTAVVAAVILCFFMLSNCTKPKLSKEEHVKNIKARMYDLERKLSKAEKKAVMHGKLSKKEKAKNKQVKKALKQLRTDMSALQERVDGLASVTPAVWDEFALDVERGIDRLNNYIEHVLGPYQEQ
jgi:septal ring factor EnvC (AmiA/AmiB activator)